jgi:Mg-chelatase subunit ChlI
MYKCLVLLLIGVMGSANANESALEDQIRDRFPTASIDSIVETEIMERRLFLNRKEKLKSLIIKTIKR